MRKKISLLSVSLLSIFAASLVTVTTSCQLKTEDKSNEKFETIINNLQKNRFLASAKIKDRQVSEVIQQINGEVIKDNEVLDLYIESNVNFLAILEEAKIKNFEASIINKKSKEIHIELILSYPNINEEKKARITIDLLKADGFYSNIVKYLYRSFSLEQKASFEFHNQDEEFVKKQFEDKVNDGKTLEKLLLNMPAIHEEFNVEFKFADDFDHANGQMKIFIILKNNIGQIFDTDGELDPNFNGKEILVTGFAKPKNSPAAKLWYESIKQINIQESNYSFNKIYADKYSDEVFKIISENSEELFKTLITDLPDVPNGFSVLLTFDDASFDFKYLGIWIPKLTLFKTGHQNIKYKENGDYDTNFKGKYAKISGLKIYSKQMFTDFWFSKLNPSYEVLDELKNKTNDELVNLLKNKSDLKDILKNSQLIPPVDIYGFIPKFAIDSGLGSFGRVTTTGEGIIYLYLEEKNVISNDLNNNELIKKWVPNGVSLLEMSVGKIIKVNGFTIKK